MLLSFVLPVMRSSWLKSILSIICVYGLYAMTADSGMHLHAQTSQYGTRWLKVEVTEEGFYQITPAMLSAACSTITNSDFPTIKLFGNGGNELPENEFFALQNVMQEQPLVVRTNTDGSLASIIFYGAAANGFNYDIFTNSIRHYLNTYAERNSYMLNIGGAAGKRVEFIQQPATASRQPTSYTAYSFYERDSANIFALTGIPGSGRRWVGNLGISFGFTTPMPNLVADSLVRYRLCLGHNDNADGDFLVTEAGNPLIIAPMLGLINKAQSYTEAYAVTFESAVPGSVIRNNQSTLQFTYRNSAVLSKGFIDWVELSYRRGFVATNNQIEFFTECGQISTAQYNVTGFTGETFIADVTNRAQPLFYQNQGSGSTVSIRTQTDQRPKRFFVSGTLRTPTLSRAVFSNLRTNTAGADMIVITHEDLRTSAEAYKAYREQQSGIKVAVVSTDEIYNEFNGGVLDITAIRDFLAFAKARWIRKPQYVMMWGSTHYNYRMIGSSSLPKLLVPTFTNYNGDGIFYHTQTLSTEDYTVCVEGNDLRPDYASGRITVRTNDEGMAIIEKIRRYENSSSNDLWRTRATFVADDSWTSYGADGSIHVDQSEQLARYLPSNVQVRKIYEADYPYGAGLGRLKPRVTQDIVSAVNAGTLVLNWIGHGSPQLWAHESILVQETIQLFTNTDRLFFLTAATCDYQRFDDMGKRCGAEDMLFSQRGGSIGSFGATRVVYSDQNAAIGRAFYSQLFPSNGMVAVRLGDALRNTKQNFFSLNDRQFFLLGDPYMQLQLPRKVARALTINNVRLDTIRSVGGMPFLQALSTANITGGIFLASDTTRLDSTFNGTMTINLLDTDIIRSVFENDGPGTTHNFTINGGMLNSGVTRVVNGRFSFRTVIPRTTSFSNLQGRCFMYAVDTTSLAVGQIRQYATGDTRLFRVGGVNASAQNDNKGPVINAFLDGRLFRNGDAVGSTPLLIADISDDTGIDITGAGIGQSIALWIDNNPVPIILNNDFTPSTEDPRTGTVRRKLDPLTPGMHSLRIRCFDVFGNTGEVTLAFRVTGTGEIAGYDMRGIPNPFTDNGTRITFRHTAILPAQAQITIANALGQIVRRMDATLADPSSEIYWDGKTDTGFIVAPGAYYARVTIPSAQGTAGSFGCMVVRLR